MGQSLHGVAGADNPVAAASGGDYRRASAMLAAVDTARHEMGTEPDPDERAIRGQTLKLLDQHGEAFALGSAKERALDLPLRSRFAAEADRAPA